ncbi:MAG: aromatic ring-hydroxylating dioxygenase subunit alpha [Burkholderiales bacterium]|jgi:vanillate O-demethylase monooxygenase subunit
MFPRNAWYAVAWEHELGDAPHAVRVLGHDLVLFRGEDGVPAALTDACPHRRLPLSMGRVQGDAIECGYHGMRFGRDGACVRVPGGGRIPPAARVRAWPLAAHLGLLWVWTGEAALADRALLPEVDHWGDPAWGVNRGDSMRVAANQLLITDNLLDPSHVAWVHPGSFGNAACEDTPLRVHEGTDRVSVSRWMTDVEPAPFYAPLLPFGGRCDRLQHYEVRLPGVALARAVFVPAGTGGDGRPLPSEAFRMDSWNLLTPIDDDATRYFWMQLRNVRPDDDGLSAQLAASVRAAFEEDRVVLEAVHRGLRADPSPTVPLAIDAAPVRYRRLVARRVEAEAGAS